jgi:hypothetical protein
MDRDSVQNHLELIFQHREDDICKNIIIPLKYLYNFWLMSSQSNANDSYEGEYKENWYHGNGRLKL